MRTAVIPRNFTWLAEEIARTNPEEEYIFWSRGKRLSTNSIRRRLERVCKKLEIYQKSPHKIRKTYGSILLDNNVDKRLVTELMGHSNIFITENHYHRNRRSIEDKIDRISEIPEFR